MSEMYNDLIYSNFPTTVLDMDRVQDVTVSAKPYVDQYNIYYNAGNFELANKVLTEHPELLNMIVNAKTFNILRDSIISVQRMFKDDVESYIFSVMKIKGEWSNITKYIKYNVVYYNSLPYISIADDIPIGSVPTDITYWFPLAIKGEQGESGLGLSPRGTWSEYTQYYTNDMVAYNNTLWAASSDNKGYFPNSSSTVWYVVLSMNIVYESMKLQNTEIDSIIDGSALLTDDTNSSDNTSESMTQNDIDNVLNN